MSLPLAFAIYLPSFTYRAYLSIPSRVSAKMPNRPPYYFFFSPTWDYPPDGPIQLGNVLTSVEEPQQSLLPLQLLIKIKNEEKFRTIKHEYRYSKEKAQEGKFSIVTKFLSSIMGLGVDLGPNASKRYHPFLELSKLIQTCLQMFLVSQTLIELRSSSVD